MKLAEIETARRGALAARRRFEATLGEAQERLHPGNLAGEAWDGVKDKGADLAEGALDAVKSRPRAVSLVLGGIALFLARAPLKRAIGRLISGDEERNDEADAALGAGKTKGAK